MRAYLVQNNLGDAILVDKDEWTEEQVAANMDQRAAALITLHVKQSLLHLIEDDCTALEAWKALETAFAGKSAARIQQLSTGVDATATWTEREHRLLLWACY